jgi:hypothetical protein
MHAGYSSVTPAGNRVKIPEGHLIMPPNLREIGLKVMKGGYIIPAPLSPQKTTIPHFRNQRYIKS